MDLFIMPKVVSLVQRKHYSRKMMLVYIYAMIYRRKNVNFQTFETLSMNDRFNLDTHVVFWLEFNNRTYHKPNLLNFPQLPDVASSTFFGVRKFY